MDDAGRRRRRRLRHRGADRGAAHPRRRPVAQAARRHQGRAQRRLDPVGAGRHRRGARPGGLPGRPRARHPGRGRGRLRPGRGARPGHRGPGRRPRAHRARHRLRQGPRRRAQPDPRGRPPPRPDRPRGRRRHRRGDPARADRRRTPRPRDRGHRARPGRRPAARRTRRERGRRGRGDPARDGRGPARRGRRGPVPGRGARLRRPRPGVLADDQPRGLDRRRHGAGLPGGRDAARPGVRAVPPDGDVPRPRLPRPAAADLRGGPRRGGLPGRLRGPALHAGRARARRPRPPRRGRQGDHPPDARDRSPAHVARRRTGRSLRASERRSGSSASPPSSPPPARTASTR